MDLGNLTYQEIDKLEENLANPSVRNGYTFHEIIIRLLAQTLRQNRYLADKIASADMRSRMAYGTSNDAFFMVNKNQADMKFLIGIGKKPFTEDDNKGKGVPIGKTN